MKIDYLNLDRLPVDTWLRRAEAAGIHRYHVDGFAGQRIPDAFFKAAALRLDEQGPAGGWDEGDTEGVVCSGKVATRILGHSGEGDQFYGRMHADPSFISLVRDFCGRDVQPSVWYGPRIYGPGTTLAWHIDKPQTHVISATMCLARDVEEPWPILLQRESDVVAVDLSPGDLLFYEGVRFPHFRPKPLRGRFYAGLFYHYYA